MQYDDDMPTLKDCVVPRCDCIGIPSMDTSLFCKSFLLYCLVGTIALLPLLS